MNIDTKQKVMISLIIVVFVILGWQVLLLVKNNSSNDINQSTSTLAAASNASTAINRSQPFPVATAVVNKVDNQVANSLSAPGVGPSTAGIPQSLNSAQASNASGANVDPAVAANQQQYLQLVTEYQMVQIQRMIAEDEEAIAIAKSNAAKAVASTVQLAGGSPATVTSVIPATGNSDEYELIFTGQQGDQWTATVKKDGQLYDIVVGTKLPDDSQVMAIDDNGVLIAQGETKKLITFSGVSIIGAQPANPHSDLSGVSADNDQSNTINNPVVTAANASELNQAGLVHHNNNGQTNTYAQNTGSSAKISAVSNSTMVNAAQVPQQPINVTENNSSVYNKSKRTISVVANAGANNKAITKINPTNVAVIKAATTTATPDSVNTAVIKKLPVSNVANTSVTVPVIKTSTTVAITTSVNTPVIKKLQVSNAANTPANAPVIKATITSVGINSAAPVIKKGSSSTVASNPVVVSTMNKVSSALATSEGPAAANIQEIKPANSSASTSVIVSQAKSFTTQDEAMPAQIAKANAADYTIQLIADNHLAPLNNYVRENHLQNQAVTLLTHRWGQDWYILVYGQYKTAAEANAAIRQLPKVALQWGPFARRIGDVQNMVSNAINNHFMVGTSNLNGTT